jgi:hypothetical protein
VIGVNVGILDPAGNVRLALSAQPNPDVWRCNLAWHCRTAWRIWTQNEPSLLTHAWYKYCAVLHSTASPTRQTRLLAQRSDAGSLATMTACAVATASGSRYCQWLSQQLPPLYLPVTPVLLYCCTAVLLCCRAPSLVLGLPSP